MDKEIVLSISPENTLLKRKCQGFFIKIAIKNLDFL